MKRIAETMRQPPVKASRSDPASSSSAPNATGALAQLSPEDSLRSRINLKKKQKDNSILHGALQGGRYRGPALVLVHAWIYFIIFVQGYGERERRLRQVRGGGGRREGLIEKRGEGCIRGGGGGGWGSPTKLCSSDHLNAANVEPRLELLRSMFARCAKGSS